MKMRIPGVRHEAEPTYLMELREAWYAVFPDDNDSQRFVLYTFSATVRSLH
jgi:hypothetical protein